MDCVYSKLDSYAQVLTLIMKVLAKTFHERTHQALARGSRD
jgi:hypothetical protein